jgi:pseudaminic acid synthase
MSLYKNFIEQGKTLVVAELSANHNQDFALAEETIKAAKQSGADAIKLQTYTADSMTIDCDNEYFRIRQGTIWDGTTFYKLYQQAYTPWEWQPKLKEVAEHLGLLFFSTPFDMKAVDFLEGLDVPFYKVASFEITDIPLIEYIASKGKPVIISTGIATLADIELAVAACTRMKNVRIVLLKCTSAYPAPVDEANLLTIGNMRETFGLPVGLSDHCVGSSVAVAAVALGARIIEKHFIMDRSIGGPDAAFSMEPHEFKEMVGSIRIAERALGRVCYELTSAGLKSRELSRSIFVVRDISAGEVFNSSNIRSIRPGFGLAPRFMPAIIGKRARRDLEMGTPLSWDAVE